MSKNSIPKVNVLIVNSHIPFGGLGQYTITLAKNLKEKGYDVYGLVTHADSERYDEFVSSTKATKYTGRMNKVIKYFSIVNHIWNLKPDIILLNYNATVQFLLPILPKSKVVSVIHSDQSDFYRIAKINYRYVDMWITPTPRLKEQFIAYHSAVDVSDRVKVISHGVRPSVNPKKKKNESTFNIVFIGMLYEHKGIDLLPEIFSQFYKTCPDSYFTIIGGGEKENELKDQFQQLGLTDVVTMIGIISSLEARKYLGKMDVMVFPTRVEAFGLVIAEAMMEGVVPIVTLLPGVTDAIIEDKETGCLIAKDDIEGFVNSLKDLYDDRQKLLEMGINTRDNALMQFTDEHMIEEYISLFSTLQEEKYE